MNQELRLKEQKFKTRKFEIMKSNELIKIGEKELKINQIKTSKLDAEILLSSVLKKTEKKF